MKDPKIERHLQNGNQNFLFDNETGQNYVLSSIDEKRINESLIFKCDENGNITDWNEVWACRPSAHWETIKAFVNNKLKL